MNLLERIESKPDILLGKPVIKGSRISVELVLRKLSEGATVEELTTAYPELEPNDIRACLLYSAEVISNEAILTMSLWPLYLPF